MRIVIETWPHHKEQRGVGNYTEHLIEWLAKIDKKNEYIIFSYFFKDYEKKLKKVYCPKQENFSLFAKSFPGRLLNKLEWDYGLPVINAFLKNKGIDIYHCPAPKIPKLKNIKKIITLHDLLHVFYPVDSIYKKISKEVIKRLDCIITDVESTKNEIVNFYNINEDKVFVVHPGVDADIFRVVKNGEILSEVKSKYFLPDNFILDVGPFEPRRNTENLLKAYSIVKERYPKLGLVLVGALTPAIKNKISELHLERNVVSTGYISMNDLIAIYNTAKIFIHPELYDGYSLQVLEAMACGCPVIASNNSCFPEIIGDAGILVDPYKYEDIAAAIVRLMEGENLRSGLIEKGKLRIKNFTWKSTAVKMKEIYEKFA